MAKRDKTCYPYVWYADGGWWFKAFDECFGPYDHPTAARHNLLLIQNLSRQLHVALRQQRLPV